MADPAGSKRRGWSARDDRLEQLGRLAGGDKVSAGGEAGNEAGGEMAASPILQLGVVSGNMPRLRRTLYPKALSASRSDTRGSSLARFGDPGFSAGISLFCVDLGVRFNTPTPLGSYEHTSADKALCSSCSRLVMRSSEDGMDDGVCRWNSEFFILWTRKRSPPLS